MDRHISFFFALLFSINTASSLWSCSQDSDCSSLKGSICNEGVCECTAGTQSVLGGSLCAEIAPYHMSPCHEDFQCSRLLTGFQCQKDDDTTEGKCWCLPGQHYFKGRCWRTLTMGDTCTHTEECLSIITDPYSMSCNTTCVCSEDYYKRQHGDCRKAAFDVGERCVLDEDCRFPGGSCNIATFTCVQNAVSNQKNIKVEENAITHEIFKHDEHEDGRTEIINITARSAVQRSTCTAATPCTSPFECLFGVCVCPSGYYESADGKMCLAELGSPSTEEQCQGFMAVVIGGICVCQPNFFYERNMRDCIKVTRRLQDSCVADVNCHTFGTAARCGAPQDLWGFRTCECDLEQSVWDPQRNLCRYFSGVGETCSLDSDCLAGDLEITCVHNEEGQGHCACPLHLTEFEGLCLTSGLVLGEYCQHNLECTGNEDTVCDGICVCGNGYREVDGICAPAIGGTCAQDTDCSMENTVCSNSLEVWTCQCDEQFVGYDSSCWPAVSGFNSSCAVNAQCEAALGSSSSCLDGVCSCSDGYHNRDGACWPITNMFESCSRTSQCFLAEDPSRVICRNSLCQCDFEYSYSKEMNRCLNAGNRITTSIALLFTTLWMLMK